MNYNIDKNISSIDTESFVYHISIELILPEISIVHLQNFREMPCSLNSER